MIQVRDKLALDTLVIDSATVSCITVGDTCEQGTFRLSGGSSPGEGLVEVCSGGSFSTICLDVLRPPDSVDVCGSLNFPGGKWI